MNDKRRWIWSCLNLVLICLSLCSCTSVTQRMHQIGTLQNTALTEVSGMVSSRRHPDVLWVHNDSDKRPTIYAIHTNGHSLATYEVMGTHIRDWEDIAIGPGPDPNQDYLYIGDIGDNRGVRPYVTIYRIPEPPIHPHNIQHTGQTGPAESFELVYPDGPRDAETLLVDPLTGYLYIITKRHLFSQVYRVMSELSDAHRITMQQVAITPFSFATGGDISRDGKRILLRGLYYGAQWTRDPSESIEQVLLYAGSPISIMAESQGEAICFDVQGEGYYTTSERPHSPIYYYSKAASSR